MEQSNTQMEYEKAMEYILKMIQRGELTIGSKLPTERAIAESVHIGRNSTREALSILHGMGVVERVQGSGNYISEKMNDRICQMLTIMLVLGTVTKKEVCEFRRTMEKATCMLLLEKGISEEDKSIFQEKLKEMKTASGKNQASLDKEFHELLMKASDNMLLITIMGAVMTVYREWIDIVLKRADAQAKQKLQMYHEGIYSGILEKNVEDVNRFIDKHYDLIEELLLI